MQEEKINAAVKKSYCVVFFVLPRGLSLDRGESGSFRDEPRGESAFSFFSFFFSSNPSVGIATGGA